MAVRVVFPAGRTCTASAADGECAAWVKACAPEWAREWLVIPALVQAALVRPASAVLPAGATMADLAVAATVIAAANGGPMDRTAMEIADVRKVAILVTAVLMVVG